MTCGLPMKRLFVALLLFSCHSFADNYFYAGTNLSVYDDTELKYNDLKVDENNAFGLSGFVGYGLEISTGMELGLEVEYQHFGKAEFAQDVSMDGEAYYFNLRPKWVEPGNNLYSALILGVGGIKAQTNIYGVSRSQTELAYQAGFELGYMFDQLDVGIGYRYQTGDFNDVDLSIQGVLLTARYNF